MNQINDRRQRIQTALEDKYDGKQRVCKVGTINILTNKHIVLLEHINSWHQGMGRILALSHCFPNRKKILYLYDLAALNQDNEFVIEVCKSYDIKVKFEKGG